MTLDQTPDVDETEIALLLIGGGSDRAEGLRKLDKAYRMRICACLRSHFPSMRSQDVADCYSDVIIQFMQILAEYDASPATSSFTPDEPLLPFLRTIAHRRGIDW